MAAQPHAPLQIVHVQNPKPIDAPDVRSALSFSLAAASQLRRVAECFQARSHFRECAEGRSPQHASLDHIADEMGSEEIVPGVGFELLHAESDTLGLLVHVQYDSLHRAALFEKVFRVPHLGVSREISDVHQRLDAFLQLDEGSVRGHRSDSPVDNRSGRIALGGRRPWIRSQRFHAQRKALFCGLDL